MSRGYSFLPVTCIRFFESQSYWSHWLASYESPRTKVSS